MTSQLRLAPLFAALALLVATVPAGARPYGNFTAHLSGREQVPDPVETVAQGQAVFQLSPDGMSLDYRLIVANLTNVFMAHIHLAPAGANGPIVAWLYPDEAFQLPPPGPPDSWIEGPFSGVLATGTITADDLTGPLSGQPLSALVDEIQAANTYVNVHTSDFENPPNTGPGDFPGGEIRGQIK